MRSETCMRGVVSLTALFAAVLLLSAACSPASSREQNGNPGAAAQDIQLPSSPNELVRQAVNNELKQTVGDERYFYQVRKITPSGEQTKEYIETDQGTVGRVIAIDGQPLSDAQRQKEDKHLQKLLNDPEAQQKQRKDQLDDEQRTNMMLRSMPDAFIYQYAGTEDSPQYGKLVRLQFKPNPSFNPPNRETQVYRGMEGTMLIDVPERRLVKIAANLTQEVTFGWGIFGRLDKGGQFVVEQSKISPRRWETTTLKTRFTGRVLLFKKLNIDEQEITSGFRPAPAHLTLAEGVNILRQQTPQVAQKQSSDSKPDAK